MRPGLVPPGRFPSAGLFDDAPTAADVSANAGLDVAQAKLKQALVENAIKIAAIQVGVAVALTVVEAEIMCFFPIGTIIGAVLSVIQYFGGQYAKREIKETISSTVAGIKQRTLAAQVIVKARADQAANEEYAAAQTLAASGQALGNVFDTAGRAITVAGRQIAAPIARPVARAITVPVKLIGRGVLQTAILGAHLVGDKKGEERARHAEATWNEKAKYFDRASIQLMGDPVALVRELHGVPAQYLMGTSGINVAKKKCRALAAAADTALTTMSTEATASIASPEYRLALRISLAKMIRQDPAELAKAQLVAQIESQAASTLQKVEVAADAGVPTVATGGANVAAPLGILAVIGYLFLHK